MLPNLFDIKSFGNIKQIKFILNTITKGQSSLSTSNLKKYCIDYSFEFVNSFDGVLLLLEILGLIKTSNDNIIISSSEDLSIDNLSKKIFDSFMSILLEFDELDKFITLESLDYDINKSIITIRNSNIPLRASAIKQLFIDTNIFQLNSDNKFIYFINPQFCDYFEKNIIPWLKKKYNYISGIGYSYEKFSELQELQKEYGEKAEFFVEIFEKIRLAGHPTINKVKIISSLKVDAGYDIISYNSLNSKELDRFIEVKSIYKNPEFYWSKNEVRVSEIKQNNYFIYLVDRSLMEKPDYKPIIIQNPFYNIYKHSNWYKDPQNWFVSPKYK